MKFFAKTTEETKAPVDMLTVFVAMGKTEADLIWSREAKRTDEALGGMLAELAIAEGFEAANGKTLLVHTHGKIAAARVLLVGIGKPSELTMFDVQTIAASVGRRAKEIATKTVAIAVSESLFEAIDSERCAQGIVEGLLLGTYVFIKHKELQAQQKHKPIESVQLLCPASRINSMSEGMRLGEVIAGGVLFARDLINESPSTTTPTFLADIAKNVAKHQKTITCEILGPTHMEKLGMGALLSIARGSSEEPRFIRLDYHGGGRKTVALVGKGITFDTGGLSLKPANGMETMKLDMSGAAAVLAVFSILSILKPKVTVVGLISATENMPGPKAVKPGDIVTAMNGKSIEILNTDAEGRVVLADALSYAAEKVKPAVTIDLATLTGACMVALGEQISGLFANDEALAKALKTAAARGGEKIWELPLAAEYKEQLKTPVADIKNISGSRYGGAINGALFLQEFVAAGAAWAHLDIAGPSFAEKDTPLSPLGGTGAGVRLLVEYLRSFS